MSEFAPDNAKRESGGAEGGAEGGALAAAGSVCAAVASSACCWLPLTMLAFGASAAGASAFFERWRPYFAVGAVILLSIGFYLAYFRAGACGKGSCCDAGARRRMRMTRGALWASAVVVVAFVSFPKYVGALLNAFDGETSEQVWTENAGTSTFVFEVVGMTCEACAVTLRSDLATLESVIGAEVNYPTGTATVRATDPAVVDQVRNAAERHGYTASPVSNAPSSSNTPDNTPDGDTP